MLTLFVIYFFLLGIIIGSFLNVVILRHNTGKTTKGRSSCMSCKTQLTYKELIPILSYVFQKGRCKTCKTRVSIQYPLVELATGIIFASNFYFCFKNVTSLSELLILVGLTSCILACMIIIFVYDLKHKIIPDIFSFTAFALSIVFIFFVSVFGHTVIGLKLQDWGSVSFDFLKNIFAGLFFYFVVWLIWRLSNGRLIGLGDAKLLLSIGTILGFVYGLSSVFISVWIGTVYALFILLRQRLSVGSKRITMKTEIPFGPFLILGFLIVYFTRIDVTNISFILENFS